MEQTVTLPTKHLDTIAAALVAAEYDARQHANNVIGMPAMTAGFLADACLIRQAYDALTMARAK